MSTVPAHGYLYWINAIPTLYYGAARFHLGSPCGSGLGITLYTSTKQVGRTGEDHCQGLLVTLLLLVGGVLHRSLHGYSRWVGSRCVYGLRVNWNQNGLGVQSCPMLDSGYVPGSHNTGSHRIFLCYTCG